MRILLVHNAYQQYGGEDAVVANEHALLQQGGHNVELLLISNKSINGGLARTRAAIGTIHSRWGQELVAKAIDDFNPDIVHVHNYFPLISPSLFDATLVAGVPSVWTLHNFRITCANGLLFRDGRPCEDCVGRPPLSGVIHRCYRGSLLGSAILAASISCHKVRGTWIHKVGRFIALNEFARSKFIEVGLPSDRITVKPNFVPDPKPRVQLPRDGLIYVGRLSVEKGIRTLIEAWHRVDAPLTIFGDGPELEAMRKDAPPSVVFMGHQGPETVQAAMAKAAAVIIPSVCYENCPMALVEAFATGTPVVASRRGALESFVTDGVTGLLFTPSDPENLAETVRKGLRRTNQLAKMGQAARAYYVANFAPESNLRQLENIYHEVQAETAARGWASR